MEARAAKRLAQVEHVRAKAYYSGDVCGVMAAPDPLDNDISAAEWKRLYRSWVRTLKAIHRQRSSTPGAPEPEAMGGA